MDVIKVGDLRIHPVACLARVGGSELKLTPQQQEFLLALGYCAETLVTRNFLFAILGPHARSDPGSLNSLAYQVRKKIAAKTNGDNYIQPVNGQGYILRAPQHNRPHTNS